MILDEISKNTNLNENEQQILKYIMQHIDEIPTLSSRELARRTYTSSTAVLRCIKKLGFQNYNDFKLNINSYLKNYTTEETKVSENDEFLDLMNKMTALNEQIIQQTKENLSIDTIQKVIHKIDQAKYIDIIANNENAAVAEYASWNLCKLGKIVTVYDKDSKQIFLGMNATKEHAVIVITKYGENLNILRMMKVLKKRKIPVISMTEQSDLVFVLADSSKFQEKGMYTFASWDEIDGIMTDHNLSPKLYSQLSKKVQVYVAREESDEKNR